MKRTANFAAAAQLSLPLAAQLLFRNPYTGSQPKP